MKKFFLLLFFLFLSLVAFIAFLFTPIGNSLIKPVVEKEINAQYPLHLSFEKFRVGFSFLDIKAKFLDDSEAVVRGNCSIFSKTFNLFYKVNLNHLSELKDFINYSLRGSIKTSGNIKGDIKDIQIKGVTDLANSDSDYFIKIKDKKISKILADIKNLDLASLLYMINKPKFIDGKLNSNVVLNSIDINNLEGRIKAYVKNGVVNRDLLKKEYNLTLPKTSINLNSDIFLKGKRIDFFANLISNLAKINVKGNFEDNFLNTKYNVDVANLSLLTPIINQKIRGKFKTNGNVKGDINNLNVKGIAYLANGKINYETNLNRKEVVFIVRKVKINKLLYMLYKPIYSYGIINSKGELSLDKNINGFVNLDIMGKTNKSVLYKEFNFTNALISYDLKSNVNIKNSIAFIKSRLNSNVANIDLPDAKYDINKNLFISNYKIFIPDLDKLYFATHKYLKGKIRLVGKIKKDKNLLIIGSSKTLGGKVNFKLLNNDFNLNAKSLYVMQLMDMLMYPQIFDSTANIDLKYNILTKKGILDANLFNGHFLQNSLTDLIYSLIHFDLTREIYKNTIIHSVINDKKLITDLDMKSSLTHIASKNALVDLNKNLINAKLLLEIKKKPIYVILKGKLTKPKIKIDAREFLKSEIKKHIKKEIEKRIKNQIQKEFLNNFLKMF